MDISVVIPTCNRKSNLLALLKNLNESVYPLDEIIIVDSGEDRVSTDELSFFNKLQIQYLHSQRSVCIQRNKGIQSAASPWIFLCDDDIEVPKDYLQKLTGHIAENPAAGAVSGLILQQENNKWTSQYKERNTAMLIWKYIFQLGIWGSIECVSGNFVCKKLKKYFNRKGNHFSKAGWPVLTSFSGEFITTPVYGLGASLIKKEWLLNSPYDEVLDSHGIGDHYGVAAGFPGPIHVLTNAYVYHYLEKTNRLQKPEQYYRRVLSLDYFAGKSKDLHQIKKYWLAWSLFGNFIQAVFSLHPAMIRATFKSLYKIMLGTNPYTIAARANLKTIEPKL